MKAEEILSLLGSCKNYLSGKVLAKEAGISRSAVGKHITRLRRYGYNIESTHRRGYRLAGKTELPLPWELVEILETSFVGMQKPVYYRHAILSTQKTAISLAAKNSNSHGIVIIAEQQKRGRGRKKGSWISPKGGIWLSVVLKPSMTISRITLLPFAVALAVIDAIKKNTHLDAKLRWPNDITISGKKVAGILIDIGMESEKVNYAVVGVGINANIDSSAISSHLESTIPVTSISDELGHNTNMLYLTKELLERLEHYYLKLESSGFRTIIQLWKKNSDIFGHEVTVVRNNKIIQGIAADVNKDGSLLLRTDHGYIDVIADDIFVRY
jgi:BirA family transcriptional regulator, biotin operon repressor / biotin---[acetyl-CoA-carboxylase] ligase